ncbi:MAG: N-formylglutamate amidohydrolase, partial [Alphaproteobacteria bacterium]|nr:N-formylglutamate amidohydrolase [Alphaproteobacteria bacterium]
MARKPYILTMPENRDTAAVFTSPHSGRDYPWSFIRESQLDEKTIRSSEDAFVDRLYDMAPEFGAPLLCAAMPRAFVDVNRDAGDLDPALIYGVRQKGHNPRITSGLGVIPRVVGNSREIRRGKMGMYEAQQRLADFYHPYHEKLHDLLSEAREDFGFALLLDCHSMPRDALSATSYAFKKKPDIVLGDRFGAACAPELMEAVEKIFQGAGLEVSRNLPFAG